MKSGYDVGKREILKPALEQFANEIREGSTRHAKALTVLFGLFTAAVVMTNAVSGNIIEVGPFVFVAGTLLYPVTFLLTDIISECYGRRVAQRAVVTGFVAQLLAVAFIHIVAMFPSTDPRTAYAFAQLFNPVGRIVMASMTAYLISQTIDVRLFHAIRDRTRARHLWLRNNVATILSQGVDTSVFVLVAFLGVLPSEQLVAMMIGQYLAKTFLAAVDTPLCYLGVWALKRYTGRRSSQ